MKPTKVIVLAVALVVLVLGLASSAHAAAVLLGTV
jgi:hypothetical protein